MSASLMVLSAHTCPSMTAPINHQVYCERHGYAYTFDATPYRVKSAYDHKLRSILANLGRADWILWIDDDAYFMDQSISLERFLPPADSPIDFIFCNSPVNPQGQWTLLNSGVFFIRNSQDAIATVTNSLETDINAVREWWDAEKYGMFTNGDQDKLVYSFVSANTIGSRVQIVEFEQFNARTYHFTRRYDDHFVCHFCGYSDKGPPLQELRRRFDLDAFLLPAGVVSDSDSFNRSLFSPARSNKRKTTGLRSSAVRKVKSLLRRLVTT